MWQFSSTIKGTDWGTGREDAGDIDMWNGTLDELKQFLKGGGEEDPEVPMDKVLVDIAQLEQVKKDVEAYRSAFAQFKTIFGELEEVGEKLTADIDTLIRTSESPESPDVPVPPNDTYITLFGLNVRSSPEVADNKVGTIGAGEVVTILDYDMKANGDLWGKIGVNQWIALRYNGQELAKEE